MAEQAAVVDRVADARQRHDSGGRGGSSEGCSTAGKPRERGHDPQLATIVLQTMNDGAIVINHRGEIVSYNPGAEKIFGYSASELVGENLAKLIPQPHAQAHHLYVQRYMRTGFDTVLGHPREVSAIRKDGARVAIEISVSEARINGELVFAAVVRDIEKRKHTERVIVSLETESGFQRATARMMIALSTGAGGRPIPEVLRILSEEGGYYPVSLYEYDEASGQLSLSHCLGIDEGTAHAKSRELAFEVAGLRQPRGRQGTPRVGVTPISELWGLGIASTRGNTNFRFVLPLLHCEELQGVIVGYSAGQMDEQELAWLGQLSTQIAVGLCTLRQHQELRRLTSTLNERNRRIREQNQQLARANRMKSEFLASMSHELRTPLNAIMGFSEVLRDGMLGELPEDQLDYVSEIFSSGEHLLSLINDILDLTKIEAGKINLRVEEIDVQGLIDNALTIVREAAQKGDVSLSSAVAPDCASFGGDARRVRQIVYNLVSNAVKFTDPGGSVSVVASGCDDHIEISVRDTGVGIAPEEFERLFRPFEQLDGGISRKYEGTGLGLALVKRLAEMHDAEVGAQSVKGEGSRFWVRFPRRTQAREVELEGSGAFPVEVHSSRRIMVVDDDPADVQVMRGWLEGAGYEVCHAEELDCAWSQIEHNPPAAVVLDLMFSSRPDGWKLLDQLRGNPRTASTPVIIVSVEPDERRGRALGAHAVLQKPVPGEALVEAVRAVSSKTNDGAQARVLVVDDDTSAVEHVSRVLSSSEIRVASVQSGQQALDALKSERFDAMILDLLMPSISGLDVLGRMQLIPKAVGTPVIVLTSKTLEPQELAELNRQATWVISKRPEAQYELLEALRRVLPTCGNHGAVAPSSPTAAAGGQG